MPLYMPRNRGDFEMAPEGAHVAVCYRVIDLGTQETNFKGQTKKTHQILISWELVDELMADGRPFSIGRKYTYSSHEKSNLRKDLESWRGVKFTDAEMGEFDIGKLVGAPCMLSVVHNENNGNVYANVGSLMRLPKGTKAPLPQNESLCFSLADRPFNHAIFEALSERLQETIAKSPEYTAAVEGRDPNEAQHAGSLADDLDDAIPFVTADPFYEPGFKSWRPVL